MRLHLLNVDAMCHNNSRIRTILEDVQIVISSTYFLEESFDLSLNGFLLYIAGYVSITIYYPEGFNYCLTHQIIPHQIMVWPLLNSPFSSQYNFFFFFFVIIINLFIFSHALVRFTCCGIFFRV